MAMVEVQHRVALQVAEATTQQPRGADRLLGAASLFEQLPRLRHDCRPATLRGRPPAAHERVFGPAGTVTPSTDSYDNVLTQVFGYKRVRLYEASQTHLLYRRRAAAASTRRGTSARRRRGAHLEAHPEFARAVARGDPRPGDVLFIPRAAGARGASRPPFPSAFGFELRVACVVIIDSAVYIGIWGTTSRRPNAGAQRGR